MPFMQQNPIFSKTRLFVCKRNYLYKLSDALRRSLTAKSIKSYLPQNIVFNGALRAKYNIPVFKLRDCRTKNGLFLHENNSTQEK